MTRRVTALVGLAALAVAFALLVGMTTDWTPISTATTADPSAPAPSTANAGQPRLTKTQRADQRRAAAVGKLLRRHGCWTGQAPAGVTPTHAVVTLPGAEPALVAAEVGFGIWLDGDPGVLHGFCP